MLLLPIHRYGRLAALLNDDMHRSESEILAAINESMLEGSQVPACATASSAMNRSTSGS